MHTLFLGLVLSLFVKTRLMLEAPCKPFLFWTAINADFQGEMWFLNPLCNKRGKPPCLLCFQENGRIPRASMFYVQTFIRDGMESVTSSGQNTLYSDRR